MRYSAHCIEVTLLILIKNYQGDQELNAQPVDYTLKLHSNEAYRNLLQPSLKLNLWKLNSKPKFCDLFLNPRLQL